MMTNNPNANLIEAMKEKLPLIGQLADMLMDPLYIEKRQYIEDCAVKYLSPCKSRLLFQDNGVYR